MPDLSCWPARLCLHSGPGIPSTKNRALGQHSQHIRLAVFLILFFVKLGDASRTDEAVVIAGIVTVKNSPDEREQRCLRPPRRREGADRGPTQQLVKVRLADGKVGWMESKETERI